MPPPRSFCPTCAPSLSLWLAGIPGSPGSSREQTGSEWSWGGGGGTAGLSPPRCVASSCWSQGHSRTAISPPRDRRTRAEGLGTSGRGVSARPGWTPALRALPHRTPPPLRVPEPGPPQGRLLSPGATSAETPCVRGGTEAAGTRAPVARRPERVRAGAGARRAGLTPRGCRRCRSRTC